MATKTVSTRITKELAEKVEYHAKTRGYTNVSDLIRDAIRDKVDKQ